jgi:hypothetical protein
MSYFDTELNEAWSWFATNWDKWKNLNNSLTDGLSSVFENTQGPSGPHKEIHWQWVRDKRNELISLYNTLKNA